MKLFYIFIKNIMEDRRDNEKIKVFMKEKEKCKEYLETIMGKLSDDEFIIILHTQKRLLNHMKGMEKCKDFLESIIKVVLTDEQFLDIIITQKKLLNCPL